MGIFLLLLNIGSAILQFYLHNDVNTVIGAGNCFVAGMVMAGIVRVRSFA